MSLGIVGYASLDYSTSTTVFHGVDATSILQRGIVSSAPGIGGIAHIARAAAATGAATSAISWVGPDAQGEQWIASLSSAGCEVSGVAVSGSRSPSATLIEIGTGGTICLFDPADCHPDRLTAEQASAVRASTCLVLTVSPSRLTEQVLDALHPSATLVWAVKHDDDAYTPSMLRRLLERADVVSFSSGERAYISLDGTQPEQLVRPGALVVETMGSRGVSWAFGSADGPRRPGSISVEAVDAEDTTGAGDTFIGTLAGLAAQSGPLSEQTDIAVAAMVAAASRAAGELLRSRSTSDLSASKPKDDSRMKETL